MLIQRLDDYELCVTVTWLSPEELHVKFTTTIADSVTGTTHNRSYFMKPAELMRLADHINDVLCR